MLIRPRPHNLDSSKFSCIRKNTIKTLFLGSFLITVRGLTWLQLNIIKIQTKTAIYNQARQESKQKHKRLHTYIKENSKLKRKQELNVTFTMQSEADCWWWITLVVYLLSWTQHPSIFRQSSGCQARRDNDPCKKFCADWWISGGVRWCCEGGGDGPISTCDWWQ